MQGKNVSQNDKQGIRKMGLKRKVTAKAVKEYRKEKSKTCHLGFRIPKQLKTELEQIAASFEITISELVRKILMEAIEND